MKFKQSGVDRLRQDAGGQPAMTTQDSRYPGKGPVEHPQPQPPLSTQADRTAPGARSGVDAELRQAQFRVARHEVGEVGRMGQIQVSAA